MKRNRSRKDLIDDVYTTLGAPVVRVNLTEEQVSKAIDTSIKILWRWHTDFSFENYYAYEITADDAARGWFILPEQFDAITDILPRSLPTNDMYFTSALWQIQRETMNSTTGYYNISLVDYVAMQERWYNLRATMGANLMPYKYVALQRRVIPHFKLHEGEFIAMQVNEVVDAEGTDPSAIKSSLLFDNDLLKKLAVGHSKVMWGNILQRFSGMTLPGNVQINGTDLIDQGGKEIDEVMQRLDDETVIPFLMG